MLALCGFPLFSGFWSKDKILHAAHGWSISQAPFYLGLFGALLTAFYMTRQVSYVFFGNCRLALGRTTGSEQYTVEHAGVPAKEHPQVELPTAPHESPSVMLVPLIILAAFALLLGFIGTPAWPWFQDFLEGHPGGFAFAKLFEREVLALMLLSIGVVFLGIGLAWWLYSRKPLGAADHPDALESIIQPDVYTLLRRKYF